MIKSLFVGMASLLLLCNFQQAIAQTLDTKNQASWIEHYKKQKNAPDPGKMLLNTDSEPDLNDGFQLMIDAENGINDWKALGGRCKFEFQDGVIVGTCVPGSPSTYLCSPRSDYQNFIFTCQMKWEIDGNSGVMFRSKTRSQQDKVIVYGPQVEMEEESKKRGWSGGIYGQSCGGYYYPLWLEEHRQVRTALKDGWNRVTVSADGPVVKTWVNGIPAAHWVDEKKEFESGFFGLQIHQGKQGKILFKDLKIKELAKTK